ncbi:ribosomal protein S5-alanine N-acetyltransferase [Paracoccus caeni]|uniref:Ribosomal protein S5-alanine N-acetyltransferase n=1 Tax=Paracoccus caeni TaxID=657651 RepID=A0A934SHA5_9RHOB|nr:ribosomal protein S5-alanine N-acetyltransferase [Paracoccus caeni]MBK4217613.1 ribosomal protein S5-alanine N-acetyltransferase [Paracoccus caeni]
MAISTERTQIRLLEPADADGLRDYYLRNASHLAPWEPIRPADYHDLPQWQDRAATYAKEATEDRSYRFVVTERGSTPIIAIANFTNIVRGSFHACHLGYSIDSAHQGNNLMFEILDALIPHVFTTYELHRIMANFIPENLRSGRLLERLGFETEGYARQYLLIAGAWRDHVLTARINDALLPAHVGGTGLPK